jgi:anti-sigma factor RsiW
MDCATARKRIEERADGLLAPGAEGELEAHLSACASCAAERARTDAVGRLLRARAAAEPESAAARRHVVRVRAGMPRTEEERRPPGGRGAVVGWASVPAAAALVVFAFVILPYESGSVAVQPSSFDVSVEDVRVDGRRRGARGQGGGPAQGDLDHRKCDS